MDCREVVAAVRAVPQRSVGEARSIAPEEAGFYSWWADPVSLPPEVPRDLHPDTGRALLYVGISPASPTSKGNLARRLRVHTMGAIGSSTFRRGLAALLYEDFGWRPIWASTRPGLTNRDLTILNDWQAENLAAQWYVCGEPWTIESAVIASMAPPMNLDHNHAHPSYPAMFARRQEFRRAAEVQRDD
jgi:hypothetical protein